MYLHSEKRITQITLSNISRLVGNVGLLALALYDNIEIIIGDCETLVVYSVVKHDGIAEDTMDMRFYNLGGKGRMLVSPLLVINTED